jgi:hypothetical protein
MAVLRKVYVNKFKHFKEGYHSLKVVNVKDNMEMIC